MSQYKAYPEYKCSKVEWIELMPDHWEIKPLKHLFSIIGGTTPSSEDKHWEGDINWFTPSDLKDNNSFYVYASKRKVTQEGFQSCGLKLIPKGSIILSSRAPIGSLGIMTSKGSTNQGCKALIPNKKASAKFFAYFLSVMSEPLNNLGDGTTFKEISSKDLESFCAPFTSLEEQTAIATFLDRETSRIDRLIDAKKRFIERLKEKRQALISHAVTKGLDPNAPMKDSGVEWIGEIPEGWATTPIGSHYEIQLGKMIQSTSESENDIKIPYLKAPNVKWESVYTDGEPSFMWGKPGDIDKYSIGIGDLLICEGGDIGRSGFVSQISDRRIIQNSLHRVRSKRSSVKFLMYFMRHIHRSGWLDVLCNKSTIAHLTVIKLSTLKMPFPRKEEQDEIVSYLEVRLGEIDRLLEKTNKSISLLEEKRAAIVTAAVTGKIDVRDEV